MIKLDIKATNLKLEPVVRRYIEQKIGALDKFIENINTAIQGWVEVGFITKHHQSGDIFRAETQIRLPKKSVRAEAAGPDIFLVIDAVKDELQGELKKYKEKRISKYKEGGRIAKKLLHLSKPWQKKT